MQAIKRFFTSDKQYFTAYRESIHVQNKRMLTDGCLAYALVLLFYTVLSVITHSFGLLTTMYLVFDGIHLLLCVIVFLNPMRIKESFFSTQLLCALLEASVLCFFALEGAITTPDQHSLYVPIAILLLQLLFIHTTVYSLSEIFIYTAGFTLLSVLHKSPAAYINDCYIAVATLISATIGYVLVAKLRRREQQALRRFEDLSRTDALTGLYNKATLEQLCAERIAEPGHEYTLLMIDLDNFKKINDEYGHDMGDEVLKGVGDVLRRCFRADDILGRFGGDEFVVLLNRCTDRKVVCDRMRSFSRELSLLSFSAPGPVVQCSAGAAFRRNGDDLRALFIRADSALYDAKRSSKGSVCFAEEE